MNRTRTAGLAAIAGGLALVADLSLALGVYFPLPLVAPVLFFLDGRDDELGPIGVLLGLWGVLWALVAVAVLTSAHRSPARPAPRSVREPAGRVR